MALEIENRDFSPAPEMQPARQRGGNGAGRRTLVIGAGEAGRTLARDLRRTPSYGLEPIGFLDDNPRLKGANGLPVLGKISELGAITSTHAIEVAIVAIPSLKPQDIRRLAEAASAAGVSVRYLPSFGAALERDARIADLRRLRVDRLLGRQEMHVMRTASRSVIEGKRVLVTGAGGSIGSELCRQIKGFNPSALYLLDHDESNLHRLQLQMSGKALLDSDELVIADIRDRNRIFQLFSDLRPDVVFHAAAHKHLPLLERHPSEGVKSNVLGTKHLVEAAVATDVERFILISTDKAADPISILGATKRVAEMIVQGHAGGYTRFASVRFGNVLGSRGSFLSVLSEQIENGEAVTVTHPEVTRFFMTVEEAVGLVIEAASMAELGETFVLDMGEPVRIVDLVHNYAAQFHLSEGDFEILFTGLRGGEKLNEALFSEGEERLPTDHPRIWAARPTPAPYDVDVSIDGLIDAALMNRSELVRQLLGQLFPPFTKSELPSTPALAAPYPDGF
jgi:FlaA1/EpsC-like NDP-sugar epimerase